MARIDIIQLYANVFGYKGLPLPIQPIPIDRVEIPGGINKAMISLYEGKNVFVECEIDGYQLPNSPMVSIKGMNSIVRTKLNGLKGSVKEFITEDDYLITIQGICVNELTEDYPADDVAKIRAFKESHQSLKVSGDIFKLFNIDKIAIESIDFSAKECQQSYAPYTITGYSDTDVMLVMNEEESDKTL